MSWHAQGATLAQRGQRRAAKQLLVLLSSLPQASCCPKPPLLRSHNAPLVHSSAGLPPREQLRAQGLNNPRAQWADPRGTWRVPESGSQESLEKPGPRIRRPQVLRLQAAWPAGMAPFTKSPSLISSFFHYKVILASWVLFASWSQLPVALLLCGQIFSCSFGTVFMFYFWVVVVVFCFKTGAWPWSALSRIPKGCAFHSRSGHISRLYQDSIPGRGGKEMFLSPFSLSQNEK